jgi:PKD repeat protein
MDDAGPVKGRIDAPGDIDVFRLVSPQSGLLEVGMAGTGSGASLRCSIRALDCEEKLLAEGSQPAATGEAKVAFEVGGGDAYYLEAAGLDGSFGKYNLSFVTEPALVEPLKAGGEEAATILLSDVTAAGEAEPAEGAFVESSGLVVMEAENFTSRVLGVGEASRYSWQQTTSLPGYSGASAMQAVTPYNVNLRDSTDGPRLDYAIDFSTPGTYYVWVRMLGSSGSRDSVHVGLDGEPVSLGKWGVTDKSGTWHWEECISDSSGQTRVMVQVTAPGAHNFNIWMREGGTAVDKVVLTMDADFVPEGAGPAESARYQSNDPPIAVDDVAVTNEDTPVVVAVLANDSDADGDSFHIAGFTQPAHGQVIGNADGTVTYLPEADYNGPDSFLYAIADGKGGEAAAAVTVTVEPVNDYPVIVGDTVVTDEDTPIVVNVLANDSDVDGDSLVIWTYTLGLHGFVFDSGDGTLTYSPTADYNGPDRFGYAVTDGNGGGGVGWAYVTVNPVNDAPVAVFDSDVTAGEAPLVVNFDASGCYDVDGDSLAYLWDFGDGTGAEGAQVSHEYVAAGRFYVNLTVADGQGASSSASEHISISGTLPVGSFTEASGLVAMEAENFTASAPGVGEAGQYTWQESTSLPGYSGISAMEAVTDVNVNLGDSTVGPRLDYAIDFSTAGTYYVWVRMLGSSGSTDSLHVGLDGQPASLGKWGVTDTSGTWHWEECITDASGQARVTVDVSSPGVHTFNIWMREGGTAVDKVVLTTDAGFVPEATGPAESPRNSADDLPVAVDDVGITNESVSVVIAVLANDTPAGYVSISSFTQPGYGQVVDNSDGTLTYTPETGYVGLDSFAYTIADSDGNQSTATVKVIINALPEGGETWAGLGGVYHIDRDGDGYGVASPLGGDADDTDPDVTTLASALDKYGSLEVLLGRLGYNPERIIFVARDGDNSAGQIGNIDTPFANYYGVPGGILPGDVVIYRQGTWQGNYIFNVTDMHGTAEKPIVFMAMPGEKVSFDALAQSIEVAYSSNIVLDGFVCENTGGYYGKGIGLKFSRNIIFRNIESSGHTWGMIGMQDLHDVVVEYSVFHDNPIEHGLYLGARDYADSNITIRSNLIYRNGRHGLQLNGRMANTVVEGNIIHTNNLAGISLLQGVHDSIFRENLIFNNNKQGIVIYNYDDAHPNILPYDQTNNLFENNIIWVGKYSWNDRLQPKDYTAVLVKNATAAQEGNLGYNVFRNNIIVTYYGETFRFSKADYAETTTVEDNLIYRVGGDGAVMYCEGLVYDFAGFEGFSALISGNNFAEPNFADVSIDYYLTPEKFDFSIVG